MPSRRDARPGSRPSSSRSQTRPPARRDGSQPKRRVAGTSPRPPRQRGSRNLTGRAAVVLLVLGALIVSYAQSLRVWFDQHQQITALQQEIHDRETRVGQLDDEITRWSDDAYVRAQARQRLGWVMPGEIGYRVIGADGKPVGAPSEPLDPSDPQSDRTPTWYAKLWGSVEGASTTETPESTAGKPKPKPLITPSTTPSTRPTR